MINNHEINNSVFLLWITPVRCSNAARPNSAVRTPSQYNLTYEKKIRWYCEGPRWFTQNFEFRGILPTIVQASITQKPSFQIIIISFFAKLLKYRILARDVVLYQDFKKKCFGCVMPFQFWNCLWKMKYCIEKLEIHFTES